MKPIRYNCIIVGSGLAGLYTAYIAAAHTNEDIAIITKQEIDDSNSHQAQGGIAAATDATDSPKLHYLDTTEAGRGLCEDDAVRVLTEEAPQCIQDFIRLGMHFDMDTHHHLALGMEGGHHHRRILHAGGDSTGKMMTDFMIGKVMQVPNIHVLTERQVLSLLCDEEGCYGVTLWNWKTQQEEHVFAPHVVMATGGSAAIYQRTTNPDETVGDGISLCYHAGCTVRDMEFVQFHPTALAIPGQRAFLISEAVRGEGAWLLNENDERFMVGKHELAELAPRDVVAREIFMQIRNAKKLPYVKLSLSHLSDKKEQLLKRFPTIAKHCADCGWDFTDWIPVAPAAHYTVGGVETDLNGRTSVDNLFAVGELASTGLMGANRLASNSLMECLVFGRRVGLYVTSHEGHTLPETDTHDYEFNNLEGKEHYVDIRSRLAQLMMQNVGIVRNEQGLSDALRQVKAMRNEYDFDSHSVYRRLTCFLLDVAEMIVSNALERKESRGGHYRDDYPQPDPKQQHHLVARLQ